MNETAIKHIKDIFMQELDDRNYNYKWEAIDTIFDEWLKRKSNLINLLSKHPNWDASHFMVHFDEDYSRKIDYDAAYNFVRWLRANTNIETISYVKDTDDLFAIGIYLCIEMQRLCETQYIPVDTDLTDLNQFNEDWRFRPGMKCTKVMGQICRTYGWDKLPDYNKEYAKYCDALSPIKVTRHTCISVNPVDYLLMSHGNSWRSCHYIGDELHDAGCYSSGTISYMLDEHSMIFYTVGAEFGDEDIEREPKIQRQVFGYNDYQLTQSRLYPSSNDYGSEDLYTEIRNAVQKVIADCIEKPNLWVKRKVFNTLKGDYATCYADFHYQSDICSTSILKEKVAVADILSPIVLGAQPICISCGETHRFTNHINCCGSGIKCSCCGENIYDEEDVVWIDGNPYCKDCVEYCDWCGEYHLSGNGEYIESASIWVCYDCLRNSGDFTKCEECGCWEKDYNCTHVDSIGRYVCDRCLERNYFKCDECGGYFKRDTLKEHIHPEYGYVYWYCEECHKEKFEEAKEQEEE